MESKWRLNHWLLGLGDDDRALYARALDFEFPFYLRWARGSGSLYQVGHVTVQPGEVSDFPLFFVTDSEHAVPPPPFGSFPFGWHVESDHM